MIPIQAYLANSHIDDLRRAAAAERLARWAQAEADAESDMHAGSGPSVGDPRRLLARLAAGFSRAAASTAERLDPALEDTRVHRRTVAPGC